MAANNKIAMDKVIKLRISNEENMALRESAIAAGTSVSDLLRRAGRGVTITSSTDRMMVRELRRIGGLLKHIHLESGGAYSKQTADSIEAIAVFIDGLNEVSHDR